MPPARLSPMDWLSPAANVAQILSLLALIPLGLGAIRERLAQRGLDRLIDAFLALDKAQLESVSPIRIERGTPRALGALLGWKPGTVRLSWHRNEWSARLATIHDPQPSHPDDLQVRTDMMSASLLSCALAAATKDILGSYGAFAVAVWPRQTRA